MRMTAAERFVRSYPNIIQTLTAVGSQPSFAAINPFRLGTTFQDGTQWRAVCPRCGGAGKIDKDWAIENKYAPRQGNNCFLCTRNNVATGWHRLPSIAIFEQVLVQAILFTCHSYDWDVEKYLPVLRRFLTFKPMDLTDKPYQQACLQEYDYYLNLLDRIDQDYDLEALLPDLPPVLCAARWYDWSVRATDAKNGLKGLVGFEMEAYIKRGED